AYNFWAQYEASKQLDKKYDQMAGDAKYARDQVDIARNGMLAFDTSFRKDVRDFEEKSRTDLKELAKKTEEQNTALADLSSKQKTELEMALKKVADETKNEMMAGEQTRKLTVESAHTVHSVLAWVSMGNQQLAYQQNPRQAVQYADKAE